MLTPVSPETRVMGSCAQDIPQSIMSPFKTKAYRIRKEEMPDLTSQRSTDSHVAEGTLPNCLCTHKQERSSKQVASTTGRLHRASQL